MNRPSSRRRAVTLVEMLVVMALSSVLVGIIGSMLFSLQRWDAGFRNRAVSREQRARLGEMLRADIRQATDVALTEDGALELTAAGGERTLYEIVPDGCRRRKSGSGSEPSVEFFAIGAVGPISLERDAGRQPLIVATLPISDVSERPVRTPPLLVYAALGADLPEAVARSANQEHP